MSYPLFLVLWMQRPCHSCFICLEKYFFHKILAYQKKVVSLQPQIARLAFAESEISTKLKGYLARVVRDRSAKPGTAVRVRQVPHKPADFSAGFFVCCGMGIHRGLMVVLKRLGLLFQLVFVPKNAIFVPKAKTKIWISYNK